jgi:hypothetical protein
VDEKERHETMNDADFKTLAKGQGILETALDDARARFDASGADSVTEFFTELKASGEASHFWPEPEPGEGIDPALIERACGKKPTLAARAELREAAGPDGYAKILGAWGGSEKTLAPGKNPKAATEKAPDKNPRDLSKNPFSKQGWSITAQGALVKSLGLDKANAIARSVGSHVGATKANPDY